MPKGLPLRARLTGVRPLLTACDALAVLLAGVLVPGPFDGAPTAVAALTAVLVCRGLDLHRSRLVFSVVDDLPRLLLAGALSVLAYAATGSQDLVHLAWFAALTALLLVLFRVLAHACARALRRSERFAHPVVVVGAGTVGRRVAEALTAHREYGLRPVGFIDCGAGAHARGLPLPLLGGVDVLVRCTRELSVDGVIFAFPEPPDDQTLAAVRECRRHDLRVFVVPRFYELMGTAADRRTEMIRDVPVVRLEQWRPTAGSRFVARAVDVALSSLLLMLLSPVLVLIAIAVRLETGRRVLSRQTRVGAGGRSFTLRTFRTLQSVQFSDEATTWNIDNRSRTGPVGRLLRHTGLDQLPRLLNVLAGDLTLVGPRQVTAPGEPSPTAGTPGTDPGPTSPRRG